MNRFYKFAMRVMRLLMPLWYKIETEGMENVPRESGYLYISNHRSNADPILIGIQNKETQFCFLAKQELFSSGLIGWLLRKLGGVAIDRGAGDVTALEEIAFRLQNGENALVFPEGTRSKDGTLGHFKTGAALLAAQTGVPVVPVAIVFDGKLHFRSKITVRYGAPFDVPETDAADPSPGVLKQIRREMTDRVTGLLTMKEPEPPPPARKALPDKQTRQLRETENAPNESSESEDTKNEMSNHKQQRDSQENRDPKKKNNRDAASIDETAKKNDEFIADEETVNEEDEFDFIFDDLDDDDDADDFSDADDYKVEGGETEEYLTEETDDETTEDSDEETVYEDDAEPYDGEYDETEEFYDENGEAFGDEESYDEDADIFGDEESYDENEEGYADDAPYDEEADFSDDEPYEAEKKPSLLFKITNPFRKLIHSLNAEPEEPEFDDEDDYSDAEDGEEPVRDVFDDDYTDEDDFLSEETAEPEEAEITESEEDMAKTKQRKVTWKNTAPNPAPPVFDDNDDFGGYDDTDEEPAYNEDDSDVRGGYAVHKPYRRKSQRMSRKSDPFEEPEVIQPEEPELYDDQEEQDEEGGFDYGKIALALTFIILGIFAIDFGRRVWTRWHEDKGQLSIQSGSSSEADSVPDNTGIIAESTTTTLASTTTLATTSSTTIFISPVSDTTDNGGANVETRETSVLTVSNDELHRGNAVLIDNEHQQTYNPNLITFANIKYQHLRLTSTYLKFDSAISEDLIRWFNDFFAATGHGNIMVYSTNEQPKAAVSAVVPYGIQIPERTTGLTLDLAILNEANGSHKPYTPDGDYAWLAEHAAEYGFIVRYPDGKEDKTGLDGKTWHFRYVGIPHAVYMKENDLCLEEYLDKISQHTWEKAHLTATAGGVNYEMYYVPASETSDSTDIQYPVGATPVVSGDNSEGFLVYCIKE